MVNGFLQFWQVGETGLVECVLSLFISFIFRLPTTDSRDRGVETFFTVHYLRTGGGVSSPDRGPAFPADAVPQAGRGQLGKKRTIGANRAIPPSPHTGTSRLTP